MNEAQAAEQDQIKTHIKQNRSNFFIRQVAVLGSGVMGAQIAAHFANRGIPTLLFDLPADDDPNLLAKKAIAGLAKINPAPLASSGCSSFLRACNYKHDLSLLWHCDLVIEAISEQYEHKKNLYQSIVSHLHDQAILASNTSGLSINQLSDGLPKALKARFFGVHFFNPPRYMPLVELVPAQNTDPLWVDRLEGFLVGDMGKTVVRAQDTPNFIANRIGVFGILVAMHYAKVYQLPLDVVDGLTGARIGRPKSATFRTADLVGLDVLSHVVATMNDMLSNDPWANLYGLPAWLKDLIDQGALGQKTKKGLYQKVNGQIEVYHWDKGIYEPSDVKLDGALKKLLKLKDPAQRFKALKACEHPQAQFLWSVFREIFHYCAVIAEDIADCVRDIDLAMRSGFGWQQGPFELWQSIGWQQVIDWIDQDIGKGQSYASLPLPRWTRDLKEGVYQKQGAFDPKRKTWQKRSTLPVYQQHLYPKAFPQEEVDWGITLFENEDARVWHSGDDIAIVTFKTKMCTIGSGVLEALREAVSIAEQQCLGVIIWQGNQEHFSAGADLSQFGDVLILGGDELFTNTLDYFQQTLLTLRYAQVPVVCAIRGYTFGGGCELMMHADRVVAALESYIGLVEVGVGVIPAAGGCKEMVLRAQQSADVEKTLQKHYKQIAMAEVAKSAYQAKEMGYLRSEDVVVFHPDELLAVAKLQIKGLRDAHYHPPQAPNIKAPGMSAASTIMAQVENLHQGGFASAHDYTIAKQLAEVMTGGALAPDTMVDEQWLLRLERQGFLKLVKTKKSQARIMHMLKTGKPLRN